MIALWTAIIEALIAIKDFAMKTNIFDRRKAERRKGQKMQLIGKYIQQIGDQGRQIKALVKEVRLIRPKLEKCQIERATCNANYAQLMKRVASLERRVP
jgi:hypothetical protein